MPLSTALDDNEARVEIEGRVDRDADTDARMLLVALASPDDDADKDAINSMLGVVAPLRVKSPLLLMLTFSVGDNRDVAESEYSPLELGCSCVGVAQNVVEREDVDVEDSPADTVIEEEEHPETLISTVAELSAVDEADSD